MSRKQVILVLVLALIGGLIGGALSSKLLVSKQAYAKDQAKRKIIEADEFRILDENGDVIARFGRRGVSLPILWMGQEFGNHQVEISPFGIQYSDKERYTKFSSSGIRFGKFDLPPDKISLLISNVGEYPSFELNDGKGNSRFTIGLYDRGEPFVALKDDMLHVRAVLGYTELKGDDTKSTKIRNPSSLVLFNEDGYVIWSAP